jgi:predicted CXXCH cytochrome family protein
MKSIIKLFFALFIPYLLSNCSNKETDYIDPRGKAFAGSVSCMECHQQIYNDALNSSHYRASAPATIKNVLGNFDTGQNVYHYDKDTKVVMETRKNELFQVYYKNGKEVKAYRFDIVMGAKNAQTSMFWDKDALYELPLSYYKSVNNWGTSPGYPPNEPHFDGAISTNCFECHSSHIKKDESTADPDNIFGTEFKPEILKKESLVYGIDCERCHGPALDHVKYHKKNPELKLPKYITTHQALNNDQKLAQCVVCHSSEEILQSRFNFIPGKHISEFYNHSNQTPSSNQDVHGNQFGLLSQSACFSKSEKLNCNSCHNPHKDETDNLWSQSQKCMSCHSQAMNTFCTTKVSIGISLKDNCIDCHMPKKSSGAIGFFLSGKSEMSPYLLRTHKIGIYPEETQKKGKKLHP